MMLSVKIFRKRSSLAFKRDSGAPNDWHNNDGVNSQDVFELLDGDAVIFSCPAQTVANAEGLIDGVHEYDTLAPGKFQIRTFVEPRAFRCDVHGIVGALTLHGDLIGPDSCTPTNPSRWLIHDWKNHADPPTDTRVAWSAGCIVLPDACLETFNGFLRGHGLTHGDHIPAEIIEEGDS